ncbi:MAG: gamma-glutamyl-gamma-aminobutyrate hydrolase family protein, partial [Sphingomonadales bacterium]|nr:gamma-glutamyl-gamma-aminobutyrate hydrolase family protein [Sphingomonadales bacterium]
AKRCAEGGVPEPVVALICNTKEIGENIFHVVSEQYIAAVRDAAGAMPLLLPVLPTPVESEALFGVVDGVVMTGAVSNVHPHYYAGPKSREGVLHDPQRDMTSLELINAALDLGIPLFCICRGFQELNVALGGSLHQHLEEIEGRIDHREPKDQSKDVQYAPAHDVTLTPDGYLAGLLGKSRLTVNSLHGQGVDRLADRLRVEAVADDGTIEAVTVADASGFALGIQWHPEWRPFENPDYRAVFNAFGDAVRAYHADAGRAP